MGYAEKIIEIAKAEVGYREGPNNKAKYAPEVPGLEWAQNNMWCATFVSWCARQAGVAELYPVTASCDLGAAWFKKQGRLSDYPAVGAQVFYSNEHTDADYTHTGIVTGFDETHIWTVEGNTNDDGSRNGDGVYRQRHRRRSPYIQAYGYPEFPEGLDSADPAWTNGRNAEV